MDEIAATLQPCHPLERHASRVLLPRTRSARSALEMDRGISHAAVHLAASRAGETAAEMRHCMQVQRILVRKAFATIAALKDDAAAAHAAVAPPVMAFSLLVLRERAVAAAR